MSKRHWFAGIAAGLVLGAVAVGPALVTSIPVLDSLPQQTLAAPNCRYDEAVRAEHEAYRQAEAANKIPDTGLGAGEGRSAYETAQRGTEQAKECEERARAWSDLWAQWQSARAASVTSDLAQWHLYGLGLEVLVLVAALGAASWAAWETRQANRIAKENGEAQMRPYPALTGVSRITLVTMPHYLTISLQFSLLNAGQSPLFDVDFDYEIFFLQSASGGPSENNRVVRRARNIAVLPQGDVPFSLTEQDIEISITDARAAIEATGSPNAIDDLAVHVRCTITGFDSTEKVAPAHTVWLRLRETIPADALHLMQGQYRRFEFTFEPPSFSHGFGDATSGEIPMVQTLRTERLLRDVDRIIDDGKK